MKRKCLDARLAMIKRRLVARARIEAEKPHMHHNELCGARGFGCETFVVRVSVSPFFLKGNPLMSNRPLRLGRHYYQGLAGRSDVTPSPSDYV